MGWLKARFGALMRALGPRRYGVIGIVNTVGIGYTLLRTRPDMAAWLPDIPGIWVGIGITIILICFWLIGRAHELELEIEPRISIQFEPQPPYVITDPWHETTGVTRYIRVRINNLSTSKIVGCLVRLEHIRDKDGKEGYYTPIAMITQHQYHQRRKEGGSFRLDAKSYKLVNIAALDESSPDAPIALMYETVTMEHPYPNAIPRANGPYILDLAAYGGSSPVTMRFKLFVTGQGHLTMEEIKD
jgi:hypothetical protein